MIEEEKDLSDFSLEELIRLLTTYEIICKVHKKRKKKTYQVRSAQMKKVLVGSNRKPPKKNYKLYFYDIQQ